MLITQLQQVDITSFAHENLVLTRLARVTAAAAENVFECEAALITPEFLKLLITLASHSELSVSWSALKLMQHRLQLKTTSLCRPDIAERILEAAILQSVMPVEGFADDDQLEESFHYSREVVLDVNPKKH